MAEIDMVAVLNVPVLLDTSIIEIVLTFVSNIQVVTDVSGKLLVFHNNMAARIPNLFPISKFSNLQEII